MHPGRHSCVKLSPYQPGPSPHCLGSLILGLNLEFSSAFLFHGCLFQEVFPGLVLSGLFPTPGVLSKRDGRQRAPSVYSTWLSNRAPMILKMITRHHKGGTHLPGVLVGANPSGGMAPDPQLSHYPQPQDAQSELLLAGSSFPFSHCGSWASLATQSSSRTTWVN